MGARTDNVSGELGQGSHLWGHGHSPDPATRPEQRHYPLDGAMGKPTARVNPPLALFLPVVCTKRTQTTGTATGNTYFGDPARVSAHPYGAVQPAAHDDR